MSFQAYLDTIEDKTGLTPRQLLEIAKSRGYQAPEVKAPSGSTAKRAIPHDHRH